MPAAPTSPPSPHFTWRDLTRSQTATRNNLANEPTLLEQACLVDLCTHVLEPLRTRFPDLVITSAYRSPIVNAKVGGSATSQHTKGQAADIEVPSLTNKDLAIYIRDHLDFDQIILEFHSDTDPHAGWVHVSYVRNANRRQTLVARRSSLGKTVYTPGLPK